jgi:REP element-mobilizing transposase RayT
MKRWISKQLGWSIWQKSFYEHIIRDREDYETRKKYIYDNPLKWYYNHQPTKKP